MPATTRSEVVQLGSIAIYHCWNRCVRRSGLCGVDPDTGKDFTYRRVWIREMQQLLAGLFAIEIAFRSEMGNHMHLVIRTRPDVVKTWSDQEVVERWLTATKLAKSRDGQLKKPSPTRVKLELLIPGRVAKLRQRLEDPSWFMAILCEYVGRRGNREDKVTGSFWEGRFGCRGLLDEASVLICGIYVDLNQIRAGEANSPETSKHTSAFDRIASYRQRLNASTNDASSDSSKSDSASPARSPADWMCELTLDESMSLEDRAMVSSASGLRASDKGLLPISLESYLQLLDASGRLIRDKDKGSIPADLLPILERLGIRSGVWSELITGFEEMFGCVVGSSAKVAERAEAAGRKWYRGMTNCVAAFV